MRAATALALTHSNGSVLFADPNPLPTPDHLHDWYSFWESPIGKPVGDLKSRDDGAFERRFEGGLVIYNPLGNGSIDVEFPTPRRCVATGERAARFSLQEADGGIYLAE